MSQANVNRIREDIQVQRIERRMSIRELAERVSCDVDTLAAFERGDDIIDDALKKKIFACLGIR